MLVRGSHWVSFCVLAQKEENHRKAQVDKMRQALAKAGVNLKETVEVIPEEFAQVFRKLGYKCKSPAEAKGVSQSSIVQCVLEKLFQVLDENKAKWTMDELVDWNRGTIHGVLVTLGTTWSCPRFVSCSL